jgi:hypothetical protein
MKIIINKYIEEKAWSQGSDSTLVRLWALLSAGKMNLEPGSAYP